MNIRTTFTIILKKIYFCLKGCCGTVIWYESSGKIAPYRTVTNQLVSWTIFEVTFKFVENGKAYKIG